MDGRVVRWSEPYRVGTRWHIKSSRSRPKGTNVPLHAIAFTSPVLLAHSHGNPDSRHPLRRPQAAANSELQVDGRGDTRAGERRDLSHGQYREGSASGGTSD